MGGYLEGINSSTRSNKCDNMSHISTILDKIGKSEIFLRRIALVGGNIVL